MAIRPSIAAGSLEKEKNKIQTVTDPDWGSGTKNDIHGKGALDPSSRFSRNLNVYGGREKQSYVPNSWTSNANGESKTEEKPETSTGTTSGTTTNTTDKTTGENEDGSYYFKTYDELMEYINGLRGQAGEGHDIYKGNMANANAYVEDYAKFLQDIRDVIMGEAQANPLESEWGKGILDYYGVLGENSANAVNAATAGENAGNIDSFAAANAERQRLSRYGQGVQSVMGMSTERFNNMINGLNAIGVNTDILFGGQQGITDTSANYAASLYGTDADSTAAYNQLLADIESGSNPYVQLNEDQVMSALKDAYLAVSGDTDATAVDWANTDDELWAEALKDLEENKYISQLGSTYLKTLRNKIKGQTTK